MSDETSSPRSIPDSQQCRSSHELDSCLYACSQPDRSSLNDNWFVRDLSRSVVSLSFRNLYLDDERTIILQQNVEDKDREPHECDAGDNHRTPVSNEDLLMTKQPLSDLAELSTHIASQKETREFYTKEMSEYVMIGSSSGEEKVNGHTEMCNSDCKRIDDDSSSSIHELSRANTDQIDSSHGVRNRASISTMNTSSTSSVNDMDTSQQSSLNASINSYASQASSITGILLLLLAVLPGWLPEKSRNHKKKCILIIITYASSVIQKSVDSG